MANGSFNSPDRSSRDSGQGARTDDNGSGALATRGYRDEVVREERGVPDRAEPDVLLDVPTVKVDEIELEVEDLRARVSLQAEVLDLLKLNVGADVVLGRVHLDIKGVEAQALLKVRLDNVAEIIKRVLTTIDENPQILENITEGAGRALEDVGGGAREAVGEVGRGAGKAVDQVGGGAREAVGEVGRGAGKAVDDVGGGAREAVGEVGRGAGKAVDDVGGGAGEAVGEVGGGAGEAVRSTGESAGEALQETAGDLGDTAGEAATAGGSLPIRLAAKLARASFRTGRHVAGGVVSRAGGLAKHLPGVS